MTRDELAAHLERINALIVEAARRGDLHGARELQEQARVFDELLRDAESSVNLPGMMSQAAFARRGKQIAKGHAKGTKDPLWLAIVASRWGSREKYARERLKTGSNNLHRWMTGGASVPRPVADKVRADFPAIDDAYWQAPPRKGVAE